MTEEAPYEVYAVDPNGDGHLIAQCKTRPEFWALVIKERDAWNEGGCAIEVWRDGRKIA